MVDRLYCRRRGIRRTGQRYRTGGARICNGTCNVTAMDTRSCALCRTPIPDDVPAVQTRVLRWRTRARRGRHSAIRAVICDTCAVPGARPVSPDGLRDADVPYPNQLASPVPCAVCALPVVLRADKRRKVTVCSDACRARFYADTRSVTRPVTHCDGCGAEMHGRADRRYCSPACRQRAYRARVSAEP
jgi:hypothetical protein